MVGFKLYLVTGVLFLSKCINADIVINTESGKVAGLEVRSIIKDVKYYSFMGIPYGKSPVGQLRFKAPEPHDGWNDVLSAKKEKQPCTQFNLPIRNLEEYGVVGQDDCLHLSIHTPKLPIEHQLNLPVIVFLYNEQFRVSHNGTKDFGPDFLVKQNVLLVMVSHRLGAAGFLAYEDELLPGNNGIRDVILALKWIQKNIHNFGGNGSNLTLMGVDGGAVLVDILLQSPKAKGLFSRAIMQSGSSFQPYYFPQSPKKKTNQLLKYLEKLTISSAYTIKELSDLTSEEVALAEPSAIDADEGRADQRPTVQFGPVIEPEHPDAIITKLPEDGPLNIDVPVMMGYNSRLSLELSSRYLDRPQFLSAADKDFLMMFPIRNNFHFALNSNIFFQAMKEIRKYYFEEEYVKISKPGEYMTYTNDMIYFYAIDYALQKYANYSSSPVYYYNFDYSGELNMRKNKILKRATTIEGSWGATMGDELCYLFVCKEIKNLYKKVLEDRESEEFKVIENMIRLWTNFAKYGHPSPPGSFGDFVWTPATKEKKECLVISDELKIKTNINQERLDFWTNFMDKYRAMAVDGVIRDEKDEL